MPEALNKAVGPCAVADAEIHHFENTNTTPLSTLLFDYRVHHRRLSAGTLQQNEGSEVSRKPLQTKHWLPIYHSASHMPQAASSGI